MKEPIRARIFDRQPELDANALELFARVVQAGSFAQAARRLGQTRAAVSRRIAAMEEQLGQPLLARTTRSLGLTETGRRLAQQARAVLEAAESARGALRASQADLAGRLRITAVPNFGRTVLVPLLAAFREQHPGISYELLFTDRRVDLLREGVDIAFRITKKPPEDWVAQPLLPFRVGAYARPDRFGGPLQSPAELAALPLLLLGLAREQATPLAWLAGERREIVDAQGMSYSEDLDSLIGLALAGMGVVLAPDYGVAEPVKAGRLVDLLPGWSLQITEGYTVQALTLPLPLASASARALVRFVAARLPHSPA
jgi:DNA-binding transcriptional LysR family regulator